MYKLKYIRRLSGILAAMFLASTIATVAFAADAEPIDTRTQEGHGCREWCHTLCEKY